MAALAGDLSKAILGHSDADKAFRCDRSAGSVMFLPSFRSMFTQLIVKLTLNWIYSLSSCVLDSGTKLFDNAKPLFPYLRPE